MGGWTGRRQNNHIAPPHTHTHQPAWVQLKLNLSDLCVRGNVLMWQLKRVNFSKLYFEPLIPMSFSRDYTYMYMYLHTLQPHPSIRQAEMKECSRGFPVIIVPRTHSRRGLWKESQSTQNPEYVAWALRNFDETDTRKHHQLSCIHVFSIWCSPLVQKSIKVLFQFHQNVRGRPRA